MNRREGIFPLYVSWWYGEAFVLLLNYLKTFFVYIFDLFSVEICLKTLFSVWRRDKIYYDNLPLPEILEAWLLNLASRFVGMIIKSATLLTYMIAAIMFSCIALLTVLIWLGLPLIIIGLIYLAFFGAR